MLNVRYLGIFPLEDIVPREFPIEGMQTVAQVMAPLIEICNMPDDFFWENHLVLLNGERPDMEASIADGDSLEILSYHDGG